jgi:phage terminase large subunit-like protein
MLFPAVYTKPLSEEFESDADKLLQVVALAYRDMDNPDGLILDEWQRWLLRALLERYPADHSDANKAGRLRYRAVVVSIPRQSGKSLLGALLGLWGVAMRNGQTLSLASSAEQARIIYDRVLHTITGNATLRKRFKKTTERRGIVSADGLSRYDIRPAKESALQGLPLDTVLADELHLWKKGMWSAVVLGTSQKADGIIIGITTAGDETSETLIELYKQGERAANGDPDLERFGFFNWTAPDGADIKDPESILSSNPAVECGRIPLDRVMADLATIPEHEARRYRLNQFIAGSSEAWMPMELFHKAAGQGVTELEGAVLAIDITPKWEFATIAGANKNGDIVETELVASFVQPNENQLYNHLVMLYRKHKIRAFVIDSMRAPNLAKRLKLAGYTIWQLYAKEVAAACSQGYAMFETGKIRHNNDPLLIVQTPRGVAKYVGESWYLSRRNSHGDIDAVLATLFAVYVAAAKEESQVGVF